MTALALPLRIDLRLSNSTATHTRRVTSHVREDYSRHTCYGCHKYTPATIRRKPIEESIRNFENSVECRRSADARDMRGGRRECRRGDDD